MKNNTIDYVEFWTTDLLITKEFYTNVFGWEFQDFGDKYTAFSNSGIKGGFELHDKVNVGGALIVLHHDNLTEIKEKIINAGGKIIVDIFNFPGGERFEFSDPVGNILAVWTQK